MGADGVQTMLGTVGRPLHDLTQPMSTAQVPAVLLRPSSAPAPLEYASPTGATTCTAFCAGVDWHAFPLVSQSTMVFVDVLAQGCAGVIGWFDMGRRKGVYNGQWRHFRAPLLRTGYLKVVLTWATLDCFGSVLLHADLIIPLCNHTQSRPLPRALIAFACQQCPAAGLASSSGPSARVTSIQCSRFWPPAHHTVLPMFVRILAWR